MSPVARCATALFGVRVERLLREELRRLALALGEVAERELGERRRVARLAHEHLARLARSPCRAAPSRGAPRRERARVDRVRVRLHEVAEQLGGAALAHRDAAAPRRARRRPPAISGASFCAVAQLILGAREIAGAREHDAEVVARLPEIRVDRDGLAQERDRARRAARPSPPRRPAPSSPTAIGIRRRQHVASSAPWSTLASAAAAHHERDEQHERELHPRDAQHRLLSARWRLRRRSFAGSGRRRSRCGRGFDGFGRASAPRRAARR